MNKKVTDIGEPCPLRHIAFIMDGNGRWAEKRGKSREYGHKRGAQTFREILQRCCELRIQASTYYVFSTENWKRPKNEVDAILGLLGEYLDECEKEIEKNDVRFVFLGDLSVFDQKTQDKIRHIEEVSRHHRHIANLALNYGGRAEITHAFNKLLASGAQSVTEQDIDNALYTKDSPELDLIVRTGGDLRISNFLLWQTAYAEFYFTDKLWPDLEPDDVNKIVENFTARSRRFGGV